MVCDIDGTLALIGDRNPYDWRNSKEDLLNSPVAVVLHGLHATGLAVVYVSGRPEEARPITQRWLDLRVGIWGELHLRADGDGRRDAIVKREIYETAIRPRFDVQLVLDDRSQVVEMWRSDLHLPCFQVAAGDF